MVIDPDELSSLATWRAESQDEIRAIWSGLSPRFAGGRSTFEGQELTNVQAGLLFERLVLEAFRIDGFSIHDPYQLRTATDRQVREQVDGLIVDGWQGFLVESKCWADPVDIDPIFRLHILVEQRPIGTLGLFFSASGYTPPAIESSEFLKPIRVLLMQPIDLEWGLLPQNRPRTMVSRKWALTLKHGKPHLPIAQYVETQIPGETQIPVALPTGFLGEAFDGTGP